MSDDWAQYSRDLQACAAADARANKAKLAEKDAEITRLRAELADANMRAASADCQCQEALGELAAAREREVKWVVQSFGSDSARADLHEKLKEVKADLAATREQVAGAYGAAAGHIAAVRHVDTELRRGCLQAPGVLSRAYDAINALTPADATAALEARDARVRAEELRRIHEIVRKCADDGQISYGAATWLIYALHTDDSRKAQSSEGGQQ